MFIKSKKQQIIEMKKLNPKMSGAEISRILGGSRKYVYKVLGDHDWSTKELFISDLHMPYHDQKCIDMILDYADNIDPDIIFLGGDIIDFYSISYWNKNPKSDPIEFEIEETKYFLKTLRERYPSTTIYYASGNHERRLQSYLSSKAKELYGLPNLKIENLLDFDKYGIKYVDTIECIRRGSPFKLGNLVHLHGDELKISYKSVALARNIYLQIVDNCILSHYHRTDDWFQKTLLGTTNSVHVVGAACKLEVEYAPINQWNHGFAVIIYDSQGNFVVENKRIIDGKII